jgi:hypothetical protein
MPNRPPTPESSIRVDNIASPKVFFSGFYYFNVRYVSGYINNRQLIGSWIGRGGNDLEFWPWWFLPRGSLQGNYRAMSANPQFLRGGDMHDATLVSDPRLGREWSVHLSDQFERWKFPLLLPSASGNTMVSAQLTWSPESGRP